MHIMQYGAENIIKSWSKDSRDMTEIVLDKYGESDESIWSFLIRHNRYMDDMYYQVLGIFFWYPSHIGEYTFL